MPEEKKSFFTVEQQKEFQQHCDHIGAHGPASQNVIVNEVDMLIICTHVCMTCGKQFTGIEKIDLPKDPNAAETYLKAKKPSVIIP